MKVNQAFVALLVVAITWPQGCKTPEPAFPQRLGDNEYLFLVTPKDAELTDDLFLPAAAQARAFCRQYGKEHVVAVEPTIIVEAQREMSAYHFSCCKADPAFVEPITDEKIEQYLDKPYVWCE